MSGDCFHCGEALSAGQSWTLTIDGQPQAFCCPACRLVAETIRSGGLGDYYRLRDAPGNRPQTTDATDTPHPLDNPAFQQELVQTEADGHCRARFAVEGLHCAACVWLIESHLAQLPGVDTALIHFGEQRLNLRWDPARQSPGQLARAVEALGYHLTPWQPEQLLARQQQEHRRSLIRLGIAGLAMMQTGMMATALYVGDFSQDMDTHWRDLFRWVSLLFTLPVATWSAWPFYRNAINGLRQRTATMDLPVSIAIGGAFLASVVGTLVGAEHVYFDSVTMFAFLLLGGRYLEMRIRHRNRQGSLVASQTLPWQAHRLQGEGLGSPVHTVPATAIAAGDRLLVRPGEAVPVDGHILQGTSSLGEAILTGEPLPVVRGPGDAVLAGSINHEQALVVCADDSQRGSRIAQMQAQLDQALSRKPPIAQLADRLAGYFVWVVLAVSVATAWYWWPSGAEVAMAATLAVLVASCPCALSLATPTALTAATHALAGQGFLITRGHVLETLPRITHACFDKTGTLTEGHLRIAELRTVGSRDAERCRALAAALESGSDHPIARAFHAGNAGLVADELHYQAAAGVSGRIDGHGYRLGQPTFVGQTAPDTQQHWIGLTEDGQLLAWFALADSLRTDAAAAIAALRAAGIRTSLLTGDASAEAARVATALAIDHLHSGISPGGKQTHIQNGQAHGDVVMMVGDGVNDAAVLAAADVSVAMAGAAPLARLQADALLIRPQLDLIDRARRMAWRTRRIMRQNLAWSAGYNLLAMPLAAAGFLPPWLAAIGMSASSLLVMLNAGRLAHS